MVTNYLPLGIKFQCPTEIALKTEASFVIYTGKEGKVGEALKEVASDINVRKKDTETMSVPSSPIPQSLQQKEKTPEVSLVFTPTKTRRLEFRKFLRNSSFFSRTISLDETPQSPKLLSFLGQIYRHVRMSFTKSLESRSQTTSMTKQVRI